MRLIETSHLQSWAATRSAQGRFPHLVKSLILEVVHPEKLRMPSSDAIWVPGLDGELLNSDSNRFVPIGRSVWEIGTNTDIDRKATSDYNKRSRDPAPDEKARRRSLNLDRSDITFVFVTPLIWINKQEWIDERKAERIWKDVFVIDGITLQDWLEIAPVVSLQFASEMGFAPDEGLCTLEQAWEDWSQLTSPPVSEALAVVGREEQEKELMGRLLTQPSIFTIRGDSPREAWGFALAALRRVASDEERASFFARTIVVDNETIAGRLRNLQNHIIILKQAQGQVSGSFASRGCHLIIPEGNEPRSERNVITLSRSTYRPFAEALVGMGLPERIAEQDARACGRSITVFQRLHAHANFERPGWSHHERGLPLLPALLAGRWNDRSDSDREALRQLADVSDYTVVEGQLHTFLYLDEPPLVKISEMWTLTAPVDAFQLIARQLTREHLDRFGRVFREVFGRIDPKVESSVEDWIYFDIQGEQGHSAWLRTGLAETLLLIAERGESARVNLPSPQDYVDEVVRGLPGLDSDWRALASLRDQFPRLMEAAPSPLLESLERLLEAKPNDLQHIFVEGGSFGGVALHTGLLWGLELLAWNPEYLSRVSLILAKLARLDPGGRLLNRPINSLRDIFLWWHPSTNASFRQQLAVIDLILTREPEVGWALVSKLLPHTATLAVLPTSRPRWRDMGDPPEGEHTRHNQVQYLSAVIDRVLAQVGESPERWGLVLDSLSTLRPEQQLRAVEQLGNIPPALISAEQKLALSEVLRDFIHRNRVYQNATWALPDAALNQLEAVLLQLSPADPVERHRWLFDEWVPEIPSSDTEIDHHQGKVEELRKQAVSEIFHTLGLEGLVRLGTTAKMPMFVAGVAIHLLPDIKSVYSLVNTALQAGEAGYDFASEISGRALQLYGDAWRSLVQNDVVDGRWSGVAAAMLLLRWPDERRTWEEAERLGVADQYWGRKGVHLIEGSSEDQAYQVDRLIAAGRVLQTFFFAALRSEGIPTATLLKLFDETVAELVRRQASGQIQQVRVNTHDFRTLLNELRKREELPQEELARREYQVLPLLGFRQTQRLALHELMVEDTDLFITVLCDVYLPANRDKSADVPPTPEAEAKARTGFHLLEGMVSLPGLLDGGNIDEAGLLQWIEAVRVKAREADRAAVADLHIGKILAHAPDDPEDGSWPHQIIRNVIEHLAASDIERGLINERVNMRGVYSKGIYEGGDQERQLANQSRLWAQASRDRWPRIAHALEMLASIWEEQARREDAQTEQDKLTE